MRLLGNMLLASSRRRHGRNEHKRRQRKKKAALHISGDAEDGELFFCGLVIRHVETGPGCGIVKKTNKKKTPDAKTLQD